MKKIIQHLTQNPDVSKKVVAGAVAIIGLQEMDKKALVSTLDTGNLLLPDSSVAWK